MSPTLLPPPGGDQKPLEHKHQVVSWMKLSRPGDKDDLEKYNILKWAFTPFKSTRFRRGKKNFPVLAFTHP